MSFLSTEQKGALYAISSGLCYGFLGYLGVSLIDAGMSVFNMLFWRFLIATIFMSLILLPKYKLIFQNYRQSLKVFFYGMVFYSASTIIYFLSSRYIGTGLAMVIFFTYPAMVMLFNVFYHKTQISKIYYAAFLLLIIGMVCLVDLHEIALDSWGIILGLVSAFFYAIYIVVSKKVYIAPTVSTLMVSSGCAVTCFTVSLIDNSFYIPVDMFNWFNIISIGLFCTAIPILLLLKALQHISSEQASMLSVLEPVFVVIFGVILLGEKVTFAQVIGTTLILSGALMTILPKSKIKEVI